MPLRRGSCAACGPVAPPISYNHMVVVELAEHEVDRIFQALADATRRDILRRTLRGGESVSSLAGHFAMSFAAVQKHVAVLERAALVTKERRGREQVVHAHAPTIRRVADLLDAYEQLWIERAHGIASILDSEKGDRA